MIDAVLSREALLFTLPALAGTAVFLIKLGLMSFGGAGDLDVDTDVDVDLGDGVEAGDSTDSFNLLSIQSIAALLMGFGWGGLGGQIGLDWPLGGSLVLGAVCGVALMWMLGLMLKGIYDLQSSGNIKIKSAVGRTGTVYSNIPARGDGRGQVRVVIDDHARTYAAVSEGDAVPSGTDVRVTAVTADRTLVVAPLGGAGTEGA